MDLFALDHDLAGEFFMKYTGNRPEDTFVKYLGEYGYMGTLDNAAFFVQKKYWKNGTGQVAIYKDWEDDTDKKHWIGSVKKLALYHKTFCCY